MHHNSWGMHAWWTVTSIPYITPAAWQFSLPAPVSNLSPFCLYFEAINTWPGKRSDYITRYRSSDYLNSLLHSFPPVLNTTFFHSLPLLFSKSLLLSVPPFGLPFGQQCKIASKTGLCWMNGKVTSHDLITWNVIDNDLLMLKIQ